MKAGAADRWRDAHKTREDWIQECKIKEVAEQVAKMSLVSEQDRISKAKAKTRAKSRVAAKKAEMSPKEKVEMREVDWSKMRGGLVDDRTLTYGKNGNESNSSKELHGDKA